MWDKDFFPSQSNSILERNLSASHGFSKEKRKRFKMKKDRLWYKIFQIY